MGSYHSTAVRFETAEMPIFAAVARRREGELRGVDEGAALVRAADEIMADEGIVRPDRFAQMWG